MNGMKKLIGWILVLSVVFGCFGAAAEKPDTIVCSECGKEYPYDTEAVFCDSCGTILRQEMNVHPYEGMGFDTPEDAVLCYLAGLKNRSLAQMLSAFAWETQADHYDFKARLTRIKGINVSGVPGMPAANSLLRSANTEQIRNYQINLICRALEYYINDELFSAPGSMLPFNEDDNDFEEYLQRCDNGKLEKLAAMKNIRFFGPDDVTAGRFSEEKNQENFTKQNAQYGSDEVRAVFAAADIADETYAVAPTVVRYGDRWFLADLSSMITLMWGIELNNTAFFRIPDYLKEELESLTPCLSVTDMPSPADTVRYEGDGFSSPEGAVLCYVNGLKNGNVQQMLQAFAWETQADRYSLADYVDWYKALMYTSPVRMQPAGLFEREINTGALRYEQSRKICSSILHYVLEDEEQFRELPEDRWIALNEEQDVDAFIRAFDNDKADRLKKLKRIQLIDPATVIERYDEDSVRKRMDALKRIYGADELKEILVAADMYSETLVADPILARYGDRWYFVSVEGSAFFILGMSSSMQGFVTVKGDFDLFLQLYQP